MRKIYKIMLASSLSMVLFIIPSGVSVLGNPSGGIIDPATKSITQEK